jgi:hypothetical protein
MSTLGFIRSLLIRFTGLHVFFVRSSIRYTVVSKK